MKEKEHKFQIFKFGMYGFLKNLMFFEPYLLYYLIILNGLSFLQVGLLYSVRGVIIYIFEIPSGVIADRYGKKTELYICFAFYILSFLMFFFATDYWMFIVAMGLFGLGEAFRSGTHKAMIMQYLDENQIGDSKIKVYGKTRSMSLIGSMVMSLVSVVFVIYLPDVRYLFLISIIPFILDLLLIMSYPKYMNKAESVSFNFKEFIRENYFSIKYAFTDKKVRSLLIESSSYQGGHDTLKDYIQPIILAISGSVVIFSMFSLEDNLKIYVGLIYAFIYLISSITSRNAHKLVDKFNERRILNITWLISGTIMLILSFFLNNLIIVFLVFVLFYVILNIRRPLMVHLVGEATDKTKRASVLSIESQMKSILVAIFAPIIGLIADYSLKAMFIIVGIVMIIFFIYKFIFNNGTESKPKTE